MSRPERSPEPPPAWRAGPELETTGTVPSWVDQGTRSKPQRIDPDTCGCTDCLTGYSVPLRAASRDDILRVAAGQAVNATGRPLIRQVTYRLGERVVTVDPEELAG